jgi:hypothetical protein
VGWASVPDDAGAVERDGVQQSSLQRVGIVAANIAIGASAVGVIAWALRRFGSNGWHLVADAVLLAALVIAGIGWAVSLWGRHRLGS